MSHKIIYYYFFIIYLSTSSLTLGEKNCFLRLYLPILRKRPACEIADTYSLAFTSISSPHTPSAKIFASFHSRSQFERYSSGCLQNSPLMLGENNVCKKRTSEISCTNEDHYAPATSLQTALWGKDDARHPCFSFPCYAFWMPAPKQFCKSRPFRQRLQRGDQSGNSAKGEELRSHTAFSGRTFSLRGQDRPC